MLKPYNTKNTKAIHQFRALYIKYIAQLSQYSQWLREHPITMDTLYDLDTQPF